MIKGKGRLDILLGTAQSQTDPKFGIWDEEKVMALGLHGFHLGITNKHG